MKKDRNKDVRTQTLRVVDVQSYKLLRILHIHIHES